MGGQGLVGRDRDCETLSGLLADERRVTVVGPGGVGKTRIAAELSPRLEQRFPGGVSVVEMSGGTEQNDIASLSARDLDVESVEALLLRRSAGPRATDRFLGSLVMLNVTLSRGVTVLEEESHWVEHLREAKANADRTSREKSIFLGQLVGCGQWLW